MRWESWAKAFEGAGKLHAGDPDHNQRCSLELAPAEFARALKALDKEHEGLSSGDPRYQAACALGTLTWHDEQGRSVTIVRHGSLASRFHVDGKERLLSEGLEHVRLSDPPVEEPPPPVPLSHSIMASAPAVEIPALGVTLNAPTSAPENVAAARANYDAALSEISRRSKKGGKK
jgi:hypothetical protein